MININSDVNILVSIVNMKLRDEFKNLEDLIKYYDISSDELINKLNNMGYAYSQEGNQFILK